MVRIAYEPEQPHCNHIATTLIAQWLHFNVDGA